MVAAARRAVHAESWFPPIGRPSADGIGIDALTATPLAQSANSRNPQKIANLIDVTQQ
jgi:hypothetical protein